MSDDFFQHKGVAQFWRCFRTFCVNIDAVVWGNCIFDIFSISDNTVPNSFFSGTFTSKSVLFFFALICTYFPPISNPPLSFILHIIYNIHTVYRNPTTKARATYTTTTATLTTNYVFSCSKRTPCRSRPRLRVRPGCVYGDAHQWAVRGAARRNEVVRVAEGGCGGGSSAEARGVGEAAQADGGAHGG